MADDDGIAVGERPVGDAVLDVAHDVGHGDLLAPRAACGANRSSVAANWNSVK